MTDVDNETRDPAPDSEASAPPSAPDPSDRGTPVPPRQAMSLAFGVTIATGAVITYAFDPARAGQGAMLGAIGALYALLTAVALVRLSRRGQLQQRFRPVSGDMTLGALTAGLLYGAGRIVLLVLAGHGSRGWCGSTCRSATPRPRATGWSAGRCSRWLRSRRSSGAGW